MHQKNLVLINSAKLEGTTSMHKNHLCVLSIQPIKEITKTIPFAIESKRINTYE